MLQLNYVILSHFISMLASSKGSGKTDFVLVHVLVSICFLTLHKVPELHLSYDVASGSEITPCNKIDKPLVIYRLTGNVMTSVTTLRT